MNFENYGDIQIVRPSLAVEKTVRKSAKVHMLARFSPGEYHGTKAANAIVQHHFDFYQSLLRPIIPRLASRGAAEFLLFQYDEAFRLLHGNGVLDLGERKNWEYVEPRLKRAIKYLVEMICIASSRQSRTPLTCDRKQAHLDMETALVCAESMVDLAHNSDRLFSVTSDEAIVRVFSESTFDLEITFAGESADLTRVFSDRVKRDRESRHRFVGFPQFDNHTATHQKFLDHAFTHAFGMSYGEFIAALVAVIDDCQPSLASNTFPTLFVNRSRTIGELARSGRSRSAIERAIDGFSVTAAKLVAEGREIWKPKQESRAYRRGFFVLPHETGPHLAFSRAMARESLVQLVNWVCYRHLPKEWETPATRMAVAGLSRGAGGWFEDVVCRNLKSLGIAGQRMHRTVGCGQPRLRIPESVGEIDFLGYHPQEQRLVVAEAKMAMTGLEPRYWRDDLDEFVLRRGSYAERFRRKVAWVEEQRRGISEAMDLGIVAEVSPVMLTLYPCIARGFLNDFPCVSLTEFMLDYQRAKHWPYEPCKAG